MPYDFRQKPLNRPFCLVQNETLFTTFLVYKRIGEAGSYE
jgi:hypothetical protein